MRAALAKSGVEIFDHPELKNIKDGLSEVETVVESYRPLQSSESRVSGEKCSPSQTLYTRNKKPHPMPTLPSERRRQDCWQLRHPTTRVVRAPGISTLAGLVGIGA